MQKYFKAKVIKNKFVDKTINVNLNLNKNNKFKPTKQCAYVYL